VSFVEIRIGIDASMCYRTLVQS